MNGKKEAKKEPEWIELRPHEHRRIYIFPRGDRLEVIDVSRILIQSDGAHRLETVDGRKYMVQPGWLAIELEVDTWTV